MTRYFNLIAGTGCDIIQKSDQTGVTNRFAMVCLNLKREIENMKKIISEKLRSVGTGKGLSVGLVTHCSPLDGSNGPFFLRLGA